MELKRWLEELVKVEDSDLAALETVLCGAHPGGFDAYLEELEAEQGASQCNVVWTYGAIAYRCRDCQINDASACKRHRHQEHSADTPKPLPGNLGQVTETAVAAVVAQLVLQVGKAVKSPLQTPPGPAQADCVARQAGAAGGEGKAVKSPLQPPRDLLKLIAWLDKISHAAGIRDIVCARMAALLSLSLPVSTMAEEVVTQEATLFLLLLYSPAFKNVFSALLIRQYPLLVLSVLPDHNPSARFIKIEKALDRDFRSQSSWETPSTVSHVDSYAILSSSPPPNKTSAAHLSITDSYAILSTSTSSSPSLCYVFKLPPSQVVKNGNLHPLYSRPLHDMRLIFSHTPVVNYLLTQRLDCLADLLLTLSLLQGMNPYVRFEYGDVTEGRHPGMNPYGMNPYVRFEYGDPTEGTRWTKAVTLEMLVIGLIDTITERYTSSPSTNPVLPPPSSLTSPPSFSPTTLPSPPPQMLVIGLIDTITERYTASPSTLPTTILAPPAGNTGGAADASGGEGRGGAAGEGGVDAEHALLNGARIALQALLAWLVKALLAWLVKNQIKAEDTGSKSVAMSLHLPLHRILSLFFASLVHIAAHTVPSTAAAAGGAAGVARSGNGDGGDGSGPAASVAHLRRLLPLNMRTEVLAMAEHPLRLFAWMAQVLAMAEHPLRLFAWMAQIRAREWHYQGEDLSKLERVYRGGYWPAAMDLDLLLLQLVSLFSNDSPAALLASAVKHFTLHDTFSKTIQCASATSSSSSSAPPSADWTAAELSRLADLLKLVLLAHSLLPLSFFPLFSMQLAQQLESSLASLPQLSAVLQEVAEQHVPRRPHCLLSPGVPCPLAPSAAHPAAGILPRQSPPAERSAARGGRAARAAEPAAACGRRHLILLPFSCLLCPPTSFSQLSQQLGSSLASLPHLSAVLQDVAEHHVPRRLQQRGYFQLKPACWEEFDPLFPHFSLSELEEAQERAERLAPKERAEKLAPKVRFWRVQCPQRQMAPFDRLPDMAHTEPCHIVVRCAVACAAHLLASRNPAHSTQAENIALLATQLVTVAATDARSNPSWLWKEAMVLGAPVSSSPSRPPVYPPGLYSTKKPGSSGSSGSGGSGGSGGGGESEWDSERLQSVRSRSSGAAAADDDEGRTIEESEHGDAAENGADGRKEDVSKQRDVPAEATKADLAQASVAAETSAVEADGTSGARNPPRNGEERGSGRRSSSSRSPDLRQQCDAGGGDGVRSPDHRRTCDGGRGDGMRSPDPRRTRDGGRGDGVRSPDPRRTRDGGSGDGVRSPDPRRTRDGGRGDGVHSPDPRRTRDGGRGDGMRSTDPRRTRDGGRGDGVRSPDPRRTRDGGSGDGVRSPDPRRTRDGGRGDGIRGEIATGEAEGIRARQSLVTRVMRDAEEAIARRTCNGTVERSGETRRTRPTGACVMGKAGEADIAHRIGSRAGMGGAVVGLDRLAGIGSTTEDVPDREGGSNMAIEKKAVGWCTAWSEPRKQGRAYSGQKEGEHQGDRWEGRARHGEKEGEARPWA
ncbi:unnamed protein product [Closterium sp. NIES-64]|nr:unnamed protein product [Closterium sp. NIES-64]